MAKELKNGLPTYYAESPAAWRNWLKTNHLTESGVWLIIYKKDNSTPSVTYDEAVNEALCFAWIDSKPNKRDSESFYQYFSKRNPKSNWSRVNKNKIKALLKADKMEKTGLEMVKIAKTTGTWTALDEVEKLILPTELKAAFEKNKKAYENYEAFPRSAKRGILEWIFNAKREATKMKRIKETVELAEKNIRANSWNPKL